MTPATVQALPEPLHTSVISAYADSLAPALWYVVPLFAIGVLVTLFLLNVPLSDEAGIVARGEAVKATGRLARPPGEHRGTRPGNNVGFGVAGAPG